MTEGPAPIKVTEDRKQSPSASNPNFSALNQDNNFLMSNYINVPKMWPEKQILPMYFQTVEKYFESRNVVDENLRFVAVTNNMTTEQLSEHSLSLSTAAQSDQPYTALKNSILTAVTDDSKTNWIYALSKFRYSSSTEKPSSLMARMISTCRMNPEQDQGTRDLVERTFIQLHSENIQNILKAQNFDTLHDLGNVANRYHNQINCGNFYDTASTKNEITQLSNKIDELAVELKHEKDQRRHPQDKHAQETRHFLNLQQLVDINNPTHKMAAFLAII